MSASTALVTAVTSALRADAALKALVQGVWAMAPAPGAKPPYAVIGPDIATDWSCKDRQGREHRLRATLWAAPYPAAAPAAAVDRIEAVMSGLSGSLGGGWRIVSIGFLRSFTAVPEDGGPSEHVIEFRARTERASQ
ncbi:MAG: DUF3168 domain-containing protein [Sphingomonadaceae bacterium]|nr:DUF3168 domain-containing protein [Sphingomonadaceae bacterium]